MDVLHIKQLFYYWKHFSWVESCVSYLTAGYGPQHHQSFSNTILCTNTASLHIHCYLVCNNAREQNSCTLHVTACYTPNNGFNADN